MDILFKNACVVTCVDENFVIENAFLGINNGKIEYLSTEKPNFVAKREIDATNKVIMPGLVNAHTHLPMSLLRNFAEDLDLFTWLHEHIFGAEAKFDEKCVEIGTKLTIAEMLKTGTTSVTDMYFKMPVIAKTLAEIGMRGNLCNGSMCFSDEYNNETDNAYHEFCECLKNYHNYDDERIKIDVGIHAEYTSNPQTWKFWSEIAKKYDLNVHIHVSETQNEHNDCKKRYNSKTPTQILDEYGVFDARTTLAHGVWLEPSDLELLATKNTTVTHNPVSNLKLSSGIANVKLIKEKGVNVALGTDGVASNNTHDLFEEIKLACILAKGSTLDPKALVARDVLKMATINGAKSQNRNNIGQIREHFDADLIMIDFDTINHIPTYDVCGALVYNTTGNDVLLTMVKGKILYENGNFTTLDIEQIKSDLYEYALPRIKN